MNEKIIPLEKDQSAHLQENKPTDEQLEISYQGTRHRLLLKKSSEVRPVDRRLDNL